MKRGELRVVTLNSPTSYYLEAQGPEGFEFQLASRFAHELGVKLVMYPVADVRAMQAELAAGRADIAAAQLTLDAGWARVGDATQAYQQIPQLIVYREGKTRPYSPAQIDSSRLAVRAGSPQERILERQRKTGAAKLTWIATAPSSADPLDAVMTGKADYALVDAREFSFAHHIYPDIDIGFAMPAARSTQWIVRRGSPDLLSQVNLFFTSFIKSGSSRSLSANLPEIHVRSNMKSHAYFTNMSWNNFRFISPGLRKPRRRLESIGTCWLRLAIKNRSGIQKPHQGTVRWA